MLTFNSQKYQTRNGINPVHSGISFKGQQKNDLSSWLAETPIAVRFPDPNNAGRTPAERRWVTHRGRRNLTNRLRFIYCASLILQLWQNNSQFLLFLGRFWMMLDSQTKLLLFNGTNRTSASSERSPYRTVHVESNRNPNRLMKADFYRKNKRRGPGVTVWPHDSLLFRLQRTS